MSRPEISLLIIVALVVLAAITYAAGVWDLIDEVECSRDQYVAELLSQPKPRCQEAP